MSKVFTHRIFAFIIDCFFISIFNMFLLNILNLNEKQNLFFFNYLDNIWTIGFSLNFVVFILYFTLFDFFSKGISLGKKFFNINVTNNQEQTIILIKRTFLKSIFIYSPLIIVLLIYYVNKKSVLYDDVLNIIIK